MSESDLLRDLFHRRWAMPTLAMLHRWKGAKFVTLHRKLGASAGSMRTAIDELCARGLVMKNPGYGHPMRPEYVLTEPGAWIGASCDDLMAALDSIDARALALAKWSMPTVYALRSGTLRFGQIRDGCPGITDRSLTQALKRLSATGLVVREVSDTYPPSVAYSLTAVATGIADHLINLAESMRATSVRR